MSLFLLFSLAFVFFPFVTHTRFSLHETAVRTFLVDSDIMQDFSRRAKSISVLSPPAVAAKRPVAPVRYLV